jgi:hypothetical protein
MQVEVFDLPRAKQGHATLSVHLPSELNARLRDYWRYHTSDATLSDSVARLLASALDREQGIEAHRGDEDTE